MQSCKTVILLAACPLPLINPCTPAADDRRAVRDRARLAVAEMTTCSTLPSTLAVMYLPSFACFSCFSRSFSCLGPTSL